MAVLTGTRAKRDAWIEWLDHCRGGRFVNQRFFGKTIGGVPDVWAPAIVALEMALRAGSYTPRSAWAYNFRGIAGATCTCSNFGRCSLHGGQGAIDIDPRLNPFIRTSTFRWRDTAFTPEQIAFIEGMLNTKGEQLWFWGGRWNSIKDYMHWEPNVDPGSTDVDWSTVPGEIGVDMWLHGLDIGIKDEPSVEDPRVGTLQAMLVAEGYDLGNFGPNGDGVDGSAGNVSRSAFHNWKIDHGITTGTSAGSGKVGDYEAAAMLTGGGQDGEDGKDGIDGTDGLSETQVKQLIADTTLTP